MRTNRKELVMKSIETIGCVAIVCCCLLITPRVGYSGDAASRQVMKPKGRSYNELWKEEDVKKYLKLPYDASETDAASLSFERFTKLSGVEQFAVVSDGVEVSDRSQTSLGGVSFTLLGPDLSVYSVVMFQPTSVKSGCDWILKYVTNTMALWNDIPDYYQVERINNMYILRSTAARPYKSLYYDTGKRLMVEVRYECSYELGNKQYSVIPSVGAQIDQIIDDVVTVLQAEKVEDDQQKEYEEIKRAYQRASSVPTVPSAARILVLRLSPMDQNVSTEETSNVLGSEVVELHKSYTLSADGKAITVSEQKRGRSASSAPSVEVSPDATTVKSSDQTKTITTQASHAVQSQLQIRAESADVVTTPDGCVHVIFRRAGKRTVKVFCFDEDDRVIAFGELTVDVQPAKQSMPVKKQD
jgi:hypothetical protein